MKSLRVIGLDAIILVVFLGILAMLSLVIARQTTQEVERPHRTASSANPTGWKGVRLLLQRRGYPTRLFNRQPRDWPANAGVVICADPYIATNLAEFNAETVWGKNQAKDALQWVERGGTLMIFQSEKTALTEALSVEVEARGPIDSVATLQQVLASGQGVGKIQMGSTSRIAKIPAKSVIFLSDTNGKAVGAFLTRGKGRIVLIADAAMLDNAHLGKQDNARFAAQIVPLLAARDGTILFDEFHQGYAIGDSLWHAIGQAGQLMTWQGLALIVLFCFSVSRRFGLSRPLPAPSRVSSEYVSSLAALYKRAGARQAALESVFRRFRSDLCRLLSLPNEAQDEDIFKQSANYSAASGNLPKRVEELLAAIRKTLAKPAAQVSETEMLTLVRAIEDMRKEIGLGRIA